MTSNVIALGNITKLDLPVDRILEEAKGEIQDGVVILGYDLEGEFYFASSIAEGPEVLWLLESLKKRLLETEVDV